MKIGILGGSFDPVHNGHVAMAKRAYALFSFDRILFIPAKQAPLRDNEPQANETDRLTMLTIATQALPFAEISTIELERAGISYSYATVCDLEKKYPDGEFFWIIGADHLALLPKWHKINDLVKKITFICFARSGYTMNLPEIPGLIVTPVTEFDEDVNSTSLRSLLRNGGNLNGLLPDGVLDYIRAHCLYQHKA